MNRCIATLRKKALLAVATILVCGHIIGFPTITRADELKRMALLVGNGDYAFSPLKNPANDARDLDSRLTRIGFETTLLTDTGYVYFKSAIRSFYEKVAEHPETISVFYYAGHAMQMNNVNHLIPVDAQIRDPKTLMEQSISINDLLQSLAQTRNHRNLIILDACRNNPFEAQDDEKRSGRSVLPDLAIRSLQQGLAPVEAPPGTLIAYATEPGNVAKDGTGRNGLYTGHLLKHLDKQLPVEEIFKQVRKDVVSASRAKQIPWEHSSLYENVYLYPPRNEEIPEIGGF